MANPALKTRVPIPVVLLVVIALGVVGLILAQVAAGFFFSIVRLVLILCAFAAFAGIGLFLWRRGEKPETP